MENIFERIYPPSSSESQCPVFHLVAAKDLSEDLLDRLGYSVF